MTTQSRQVNGSPSPSALSIDGIPIRNIWLLMLYASELSLLPTSSRVKVEDNPDEIPDLVAEILCHAVDRRLRRNLTAGYYRREAELTRLKGRISLLKTESRQLLRRGRVACSFEELTMDTQRNRYVRAALLKLTRLVSNPTLSRRCRILAHRMERFGVGNDSVSAFTYSPSSDTPGTLGAEDRQMLAAARLAFDLAVPTEASGHFYFDSPERQKGGWIRQLFENAVGGFYEVVLSRQKWQVYRGKRIYMPVADGTCKIESYLSSMETDIELESQGAPKHRIVIDTKFTSILRRNQYDQERFKREYVFQMYTYVRSQEDAANPISLNSSAVLLHPTIDLDIDEAAHIQGHEFRFLTVDLAANTQTIREQLLRVTVPRLTTIQ